MKHRSLFRPVSLLAVVALLPLAGTGHAESASSQGSRITASIGPLRTSRGSMGCRLYASPEGFPRTKVGTQNVRVKVASTSARCVFEHLKPGTYAVMAHHDENDNKKFDTNFLGIPLEGYGVSNNHTYAMRAPRWEESIVKVEAGKDVTLKISIRY